MWVKEKLLVTSNFFFSHDVFKRLVLQTCKNKGLFGKGLHQASNQVCLQKGEIACYNQFLLLPQCFEKACTADI